MPPAVPPGGLHPFSSSFFPPPFLSVLLFVFLRQFDCFPPFLSFFFSPVFSPAFCLCLFLRLRCWLFALLGSSGPRTANRPGSHPYCSLLFPIPIVAKETESHHSHWYTSSDKVVSLTWYQCAHACTSILGAREQRPSSQTGTPAYIIRAWAYIHALVHRHSFYF